MLAAVVCAPGVDRILPLPPEFVQPQDDPGEDRPADQRKQDCETNAAKRWFRKWHDQLRSFRPIYLGDALYATHPFCRMLPDAGADFIFVVKQGSHGMLFDCLHESFFRTKGWLQTRDPRSGVRERHRYRWMPGLPIRNSDDAVTGTWIEMEVLRRKHGKWERYFYTTFFTSLDVTMGNVMEIATCGRARWKVENEGFNCLTNLGPRFKHSFGHGRAGLASVLATLQLLAFGLHAVLDLLEALWQQGRAALDTREAFFAELLAVTRLLPCPRWRTLLGVVLGGVPGAGCAAGA